MEKKMEAAMLLCYLGVGLRFREKQWTRLPTMLLFGA